MSVLTRITKQQSLNGPHVGNLYTTFYSLAVSNYITHKYGYWICVWVVEGA